MCDNTHSYLTQHDCASTRVLWPTCEISQFSIFSLSPCHSCEVNVGYDKEKLLQLPKLVAEAVAAAAVVASAVGWQCSASLESRCL